MKSYTTANPPGVTAEWERRKQLHIEIAPLQKGIAGLLALSAVCNTLAVFALVDERARASEAKVRYQTQLQQAEEARDYAVRQLGEAVLQAEADKQAWVEQAAAYEAVGAYRYIGECTITAYCPCEECCGQWADGLTATGIPAEPGIVAVDPDVIPLGSTVVINGQRYLAADTGVTGNAVDICTAGHQEAEEFGVQRQEVWVAENG